MIELVRPTVDLADSWWAMVDAFGAEPIPGSGLHDGDREQLREPTAFEGWVNWLALQEIPGDHIDDGRVPALYRWIVEDERVVGTITLRLALDDVLVESGGHIAYAAQPGSRRRGVVSAALGRVLGLASVRGIDPVLITCEDDNVASARTIERAGGVLEDVRGGLRRYWVATGLQEEGPA